MPVAFADLAQTCAPIIAAEALAGVVSLESRFEPYAIRINSGPSLTEQPKSRVEAIQIATSLAAEGLDIQLGLGGIGMEELRKLNLSITDAFDPCLNLQAIAMLLDGYYRLALEAGADGKQAEQVMLQSWYGRADPSVGEMVRYDEQIRDEIERLGPSLTTLMIREGIQGRERRAETPAAAPPEEIETGDAPSAPSWDVFNSRRQSSVLVFQNNRMEQSE